MLEEKKVDIVYIFIFRFYNFRYGCPQIYLFKQRDH